MYVPSAFEMAEREAMWAHIERHPFGVLVTMRDGAPFATHLPFVRDGEALLGHVARANPQWQGLAEQEALAVFSGPHAYVSPAWYEAERVVPTWNYVAVHAYGRCRLVEGDELMALLARSVEAFDRSGWRLDEGYAAKLAGGIVGFRMEGVRLEGKAKLSQNQPAERQEKVARRLEEGGADERAVAALIRARLAEIPLEKGDRVS